MYTQVGSECGRIKGTDKCYISCIVDVYCIALCLI